jgi:hypothetical protein
MLLAHLKTSSAPVVPAVPAAAVPVVSPVDVPAAAVPVVSPVDVPAAAVPVVSPVDVPAAAELVTIRPIDVPAPEREPTIETLDALQPLQGKTRHGDFVHNSQPMATERGFGNVSELWARRADDRNDSTVMTYDDALEFLERDRGTIRDIECEYGRFSPHVIGGAVVLRDNATGEQFRFTDSSLDQFSERCNVGATLPRRLISGDTEDREILKSVFDNGLRKIAERSALIRTRTAAGQAPTVRAFLSDQYARIDNRWLLETLREIVPGALVSHFSATDGSDSVYFNLLIPDSMRAETDSDYGGMLACGNSEIGHRRLKTLPSVFRAICMNGCIWDRVDGVAFTDRVHRGEINLNALKSAIRENLNRQIPLLGDGINRMLATRSIVTDKNELPVIGAVLKSLSFPGITKQAADSIVGSFQEQRQLIDAPAAISAFDVIQGITAAARSFDCELKENAERVAGVAMFWDKTRWDDVFRSAGSLKTRDLEKLFSTVS